MGSPASPRVTWWGSGRAWPVVNVHHVRTVKPISVTPTGPSGSTPTEVSPRRHWCPHHGSSLAGSSITADLAALIQPMSIGMHATRRGRVEAGDRVLVLGAGGIGSFVIYAAAASGATVTAMDLDPQRLAAASRLGAATTTDVSALGPEEELNEDKPTVVLECTGRPDSLLRALRLVADGGRVVVVGHQPEPVAVDFREVALDELEIIGTQAHVLAQDFPAAVDLIAADPGPGSRWRRLFTPSIRWSKWA